MASQNGIRAGKAFVELYADDKKLTRGLRSAQRKLKMYGQQITSLGKQVAMAGATIAVPLAFSLKIGANFADQMSKVKAVTSGTAAEFDKLNEKAKELGRTTSFTATQVAEGMVELGRAGFSRKEIDQSIEGMLNLSRATDTELAEATAIAAASLRQFNLEASQSGRVSDVLTATANGSAQTLTDLGEALNYVAPLAAEAGEGIEMTAAAIGIMANNGIKGSAAGTALARAYKNLSADKTAKDLAAIGVSVADANGNLRPMADILADIGMATANMGTKERLAIFESLFGRGMAANIKLAKGAAEYQVMLEKIQKSQGIAGKTAKEMDDNLGGAFRMFMSAAEGVAIAIKDALDVPARKALGIVTEFLGSVTEWIEKNQGLVKALAAIGAVLLVVGGALIAVGTTVSVLSFAMGGLAMIVPAIASGLAFLASPAAAVIASIIGISAAIGGLVSLMVAYWDKVKQFGRVILSVLGGVVEYMKSGVFAMAGKLLWASLKVVWENGVSDIGKTWMKLKEAWGEVIDGFVSAWKKAIGQVRGEWEKFEAHVRPAPEGPVKITTLTKEELEDWIAGGKKQAGDDNPIMPLFGEEEDPAVMRAQKEYEEAMKRLNGVSTNIPEVKRSRDYSDEGSPLRNIISLINGSSENRTLKELQRSSGLLQEISDQLKRNKLQFVEAD